ncbi:hypothetical protein U1Q18_010874, partial [Sarracenia purpurea var. burkii]
MLSTEIALAVSLFFNKWSSPPRDSLVLPFFTDFSLFGFPRGLASPVWVLFSRLDLACLGSIKARHYVPVPFGLYGSNNNIAVPLLFEFSGSLVAFLDF